MLSWQRWLPVVVYPLGASGNQVPAIQSRVVVSCFNEMNLPNSFMSPDMNGFSYPSVFHLEYLYMKTFPVESQKPVQCLYREAVAWGNLVA